MTRPHRYIQNQFVRLSRGTLNGLPLLMPGKDGKLCEEIREIFRRDAGRFNITVLALNVEPYGYEAVIFDPGMRRSEFLKSVNQCISMKVKKTIDHSESVWSNKKPGNIPILDLETLENEIFEVCIKPVKRGYVREISKWVLPQIGPSDWPEISVHSTAKKTLDSGVEEIELESFSLSQTAPIGGRGLFSEGGKLEDIGRSKTDLLDRIASFQKEEKRRRRKIVGQKECRNRDSFLTDAARYREEYRAPNPPVLCATKGLLAKTLLCLKAYYTAYREALTVFVETKKSLFPSGILKMRTFFKASFSPVGEDDFFHFVK